MNHVSPMLGLLRDPRRHLPHLLAHPAPPMQVLSQVVLPLASLLPLTILVRAILIRTILSGVVLALSGLLLQVATWALLGRVMPRLLHPFAIPLSRSQAFSLAAAICAPMWFGGLLYLVPEDPTVLFLLARLAVLAVGAYGLVILLRALELLATTPGARPPAFLTVAGAYAGIYLVLFVVVGILANVILYLRAN